jgi:hypothetical protein
LFPSLPHAARPLASQWRATRSLLDQMTVPVLMSH